MDRTQTTTRMRLPPQGSVNLSDLGNSVSRTRAEFTRVRAAARRLNANAGPKADFITFVSLACEIYQGQDTDLVPIQQYPSVLETYQGKGHTSLVSRAEVAFAAPSNVNRGAIGSYSEGIVIKRPRHSILEEKSYGFTSFITELRIRSHPSLRSLPYIAKLRGVGWDFEDEDATIPRPILLEEFAPQGALDNFWANWKFVRLSFKAKLEFCQDIATGLQSLHRCGVVHGDVKPENILVFPCKDARDSFMLKLTDFGHSVLESDQLEMLPAFTPKWSAPEATKTTSMTFNDMKATDCYSFGLVILSIMLGHAFYDDVEDVEKCKQDGSILRISIELLEKEDKVSNDSDLEVGTVVSLLHKTLQLRPKARSLERCISVIDTYELDNQVAIYRLQYLSSAMPKIPAVDVTQKVIIGYHTLSRCSHQLKANIAMKLREIADNPKDPRKPAAEWELAICYFSGFGVSRDFEASFQWLCLARDHGIVAAETYFKPLEEAINVAKTPKIQPAPIAHYVEESNGEEEKETSHEPASVIQAGVTDAKITDSTAAPVHRAAKTGSGTCAEASYPGTKQANAMSNSISMVLRKYLLSDEEEEEEALRRMAQAPMTKDLRDAIQSGSLQEVQQFIDNDPYFLNSRDEDGNTPLLLAAQKGRFEILQYLLSQPELDASVWNQSGQTVLHHLTNFEDVQTELLVYPLVEKKADLGHEAHAAMQSDEKFMFSGGLRCCPILNAILHNKMALLERFLDATHSEISTSVCRVCEAGSSFRRILAISLSLFRTDALDLLMAHIKTYHDSQSLNLKDVQVWAGQELLPLHKVPFRSITVAAMDLPESFFRAMMYGERYQEVLKQTIRFLSATRGDSGYRGELEASMLIAAMAGGSLDAVNVLLSEQTKLKREFPLWWVMTKDKSLRFLEALDKSPQPFNVAIQLGQRDIFDRLLSEDDCFLKKHHGLPCDRHDCWEKQPPQWNRAIRARLGRPPHVMRPLGHVHERNVVLKFLTTATVARHQDSHFWDTIIDRSNNELLEDPMFLVNSITNSNFKAAERLIKKCPGLWHKKFRWPSYLMDKYKTWADCTVRNYQAMPKEGSAAAYVLCVGSYKQCKFVLEHLLAERPTYYTESSKLQNIFRRIKRKKLDNVVDEGVPAWQLCPLERQEYECLVLGNIKRTRPDRKVLWDVIEIQVAYGQPASTSYLKFAINYFNPEALQEMLDRGWNVDGAWYDIFDTPLQHTINYTRVHFIAFELEHLGIKEPEDDEPPPLYGPILQTHEDIYRTYRNTREEAFGKRFNAKLDQCFDLLSSRGGRASPLANLAPVNGKTTKLGALILHALLYLIVLPLVLVYATKGSWNNMSMGQKFGFVYLWALLAYFFPHPILFIFGPANERSGKVLWTISCTLIFIFNHFGLTYLVIGFAWSPFVSCHYWLEDGQLAKSCTSYSFLLPLVAGIFEFVFGLGVMAFIWKSEPWILVQDGVRTRTVLGK